MGNIHAVIPYLRLRRAADAIRFYQEAFGAVELFRLNEPGGRIGHAELKLGGTVLMLSDEYPEVNARGPESIGGTSVSIHLEVDDVDAFAARAAQAGATIVRAPANQFYGERNATIRDPFGHEWLLGQKIEEVSHEEVQRRFNAMFS